MSAITPRPPTGHLAQWFQERGVDPNYIVTEVVAEWSSDGATVRWESMMRPSPEGLMALAKAMDADDHERRIS